MFNRLLKTSASTSFFLFGARGTGKTTYIKETFDPSTSLYIDLLNPALEDRYMRRPESLEQQVKELSKNISWVILDEIQKVPRLLDVVHRLIELTSLQFVLTGSSGRKLKRGASNLLAGRAFVYHLHPLTHVELKNHFNLDNTLRWGTLPKVFSFERDNEKAEYLRAYALTYLKEEITAEQIIRKLDPFREFLEVAAQSNGKIINYAKIADDVGVDTKTVISYFSILEETLVGFILPAFHKSIRKQQRTNPKFYFFDTGVKRSLERTLTVEIVEGTYAYGNAFEHFIIVELIRLASYLRPDWRFYYLTTGAGAEIDLIIDRPGFSYAFIEIKSTQNVDERDTAQLARFLRDFGGAEGFCVSRDPIRKKIDVVLCIPWQEMQSVFF